MLNMGGVTRSIDAWGGVDTENESNRIESNTYVSVKGRKKQLVYFDCIKSMFDVRCIVMYCLINACD
jgi:hypothetical protein